MLKNDTVSLPSAVPCPPPGGLSTLCVSVISGQTPASSLSFSSMTNAPAHGLPVSSQSARDTASQPAFVLETSPDGDTLSPPSCHS